MSFINRQYNKAINTIYYIRRCRFVFGLGV